MKIKSLIGLIPVLLFTSCVALKPHDMVYLNDDEMQMGSSTSKNFENYIESIREGDTPSGGSKSSGGCGCN